ncbi:hypothetical protein E2C01_041710 [Portunus trituberculatus]|uniref:Uncharacterized protein n=1 Tax=Portunus trituberculatus TaxID=210409 RepID=A0A5B7FRR3_PORTR|nr:hypothetical protein [Portunus trituberculatus]
MVSLVQWGPGCTQVVSGEGGSRSTLYYCAEGCGTSPACPARRDLNGIQRDSGKRPSALQSLVKAVGGLAMHEVLDAEVSSVWWGGRGQEAGGGSQAAVRDADCWCGFGRDQEISEVDVRLWHSSRGRDRQTVRGGTAESGFVRLCLEVPEHRAPEMVMVMEQQSVLFLDALFTLSLRLRS